MKRYRHLMDKLEESSLDDLVGTAEGGDVIFTPLT